MGNEHHSHRALFHNNVNCYAHTALVVDELVWNTGGMVPTGQKHSTWRKTCPSAASPTTNLTWREITVNTFDV